MEYKRKPFFKQNEREVKKQLKKPQSNIKLKIIYTQVK